MSQVNVEKVSELNTRNTDNFLSYFKKLLRFFK